MPITVNDWLLNDVLRGEWGYTGTLITDWDNVGRMVWEQQVQPDYAHAAAAAVNAGNDMIMTTPGFFQGALDALAQGLLTEEALDRAVARILLLKFEFGLFADPRLPDEARIASEIATAEHRALNLDLARRSLVLLRNDGLLPLDGGYTADAGGRALPGAAGARRVAVIGPLADDAQTQLGDWAGGSGQAGWLDGQPRDMITTVLDGFRAYAPADWTVTHARGADVLTLEADPAGAFFPDGQPRPQIVVPSPPDDALIAEAVAAARAADVAVVVVGDVIELVGEGRSTATLDLIGGQIALLDALAVAGTPFVVVLIASKPLVLPPSAQRAAAVIWAASPGMQGGRAIAELAARSHRADRASADLVRPSRRSAADLLQPDPRPARQPLRGPHPVARVGVRRGTVVHDRRVRPPAHRRHRARPGRHRARDGRAAQHRHAPRTRDRAALRARHRHLGQLGRQGAQGVPPRRPASPARP